MTETANDVSRVQSPSCQSNGIPGVLRLESKRGAAFAATRSIRPARRDCFVINDPFVRLPPRSIITEGSAILIARAESQIQLAEYKGWGRRPGVVGQFPDEPDNNKGDSLGIGVLDAQQLRATMSG